MGKTTLLERAKQYCEAGKHRFTQPRERVITVLSNATEPMGAYQILEKLAEGQGKTSPPTVYRAIEFWMLHGFIHRVQSMNAYIACCEHDHHENFCIFICDNCNDVIEMKMNLPAPVSADAKKKHLTISSSNTEIHGSCNQCS